MHISQVWNQRTQVLIDVRWPCSFAQILLNGFIVMLCLLIKSLISLKIFRSYPMSWVTLISFATDCDLSSKQLWCTWSSVTETHKAGYLTSASRWEKHVGQPFMNICDQKFPSTVSTGSIQSVLACEQALNYRNKNVHVNSFEQNAVWLYWFYCNDQYCQK